MGNLKEAREITRIGRRVIINSSHHEKGVIYIYNPS
jgi:hypothetical protein